MVKNISLFLAPLLLCSLGLVKCNQWLSKLPDGIKINTLAFIGTHESAAYGTNRYIALTQTQEMTIAEQLEAGIRVFDMRVRKTDHAFAMHHGPVFLGKMFSSLAITVVDYLRNHPKEFVIMIMQKEHTVLSSMSDCEILEKYKERFKNIFVTNWTINQTIGEHRGKILLVQGHRGFKGCTLELPCKEQNNYEINGNYGLDKKLLDIKKLQDEVSATLHSHRCYINYLSANGFNFTIPAMIAEGFVEMPTNLNSMFNRAIVRQGTNELMLSEFKNPKNTLYIVMADYPDQGLINKIVNSNF